MKRNLFSRFFPLPKYLEMRPVAIDLSDRSLKFFRDLKVFGERVIPAGAIDGGRIKDPTVVVEVLKSLVAELGTKYISLSLPEEPGYTFILSLPAASGENLRQAIELQLEEHIPLPATGVLFDYEIFKAPLDKKGNYELAVSVFPKNLSAQYVELFTKAGLVPVIFEGEGQAAVRAVTSASNSEVVLVADLGRTRSSFFISQGGCALSSMTLKEISGEFLNRAVEKGLGIVGARAEELKTSRGLLQSEDQVLLEALLPPVSVLRDEINKFIEYWNSRCLEFGSAPVARVILVGGGASLPGLVDYLASSLKLPVTAGDVWLNFGDSRVAVPPLTKVDSRRYATTIGLALRNFIFRQ